MRPEQILSLRSALGLSQVQFAQLFGVHFMTVSKWERGKVAPSPYQVALMSQFQQTTAKQQLQAQEVVKNLLVGAGVVAALAWLLATAAKR